MVFEPVVMGLDHGVRGSPSRLQAGVGSDPRQPGFVSEDSMSVPGLPPMIAPPDVLHAAAEASGRRCSSGGSSRAQVRGP